MWNVYRRRCRGRARTNNSVESFRNTLRSGLVRASRPTMWSLIDGLKALHGVINVDLAAIARGETKEGAPKQAPRSRRIQTLVNAYEQNRENGGEAWFDLCRGIAYSYTTPI